VQHRRMRVPMQHPKGEVALLASPLRFADTPVTYDVPPPLLGQHTREVLQQVLGCSDAQIDALQAKRIV
jgi:crotonobetainyl-CoA:carnitine CoA-transferase CaiB-like acyl-CoA transferase